MTFKPVLKWKPIFIFASIYAKHKGFFYYFVYHKCQQQKESFQNETEVTLKISSQRISFDMFFFFHD